MCWSEDEESDLGEAEKRTNDQEYAPPDTVAHSAKRRGECQFYYIVGNRNQADMNRGDSMTTLGGKLGQKTPKHNRTRSPVGAQDEGAKQQRKYRAARNFRAVRSPRVPG